MRRLVTTVLVAILCLAAGRAAAVDLVGEARFYDPTGTVIGQWDGVTGDLDEGAGTMSLSPVSFFGFSFGPISMEVLGEGTHTRNDPSSGTPITVTVAPGQMGAFADYQWSINQFSGFLVWDVVTHPGGRAFVPVDSDGDGIPGHAFVVGPFPGFTVVYELQEGSPPPAVDLSLAVIGGTHQECAETGGTAVTVNATVDLIGGAELSEVQWSVDGASAGTGMSINPFLSLGAHTVEATAIPTVGLSDTEQVTISIADTTTPEVTAAFVDPRTGEVVEAAAREKVVVSYSAADVCDPAPVVNASVVPVFAVDDGQVLQIGGDQDQVRLPASAIRLTVAATDGSGNTATGDAVLHIVP